MPSGVYEHGPKIPKSVSEHVEAVLVNPMPWVGFWRLVAHLHSFHIRALPKNCGWMRVVGVHNIYHGTTSPHSWTCERT